MRQVVGELPQKNDSGINKTAYDHDYYAQGEEKYRLNKIFQPFLTLLYSRSVQATLARLDYMPGSNRRALDVGAGRGEFLYYLRKKGWQVVGTQISASAIFAAKRFYDIDLLETPFPTASELGKFDLITYWHVFEHLDNPQEHLAEARNLLRDEKSTLIIEVPNPESLGAQICYKAWLGSDIEHHKQMLSRTELLAMYTVAKLQVVRAESFSSKFTLIYLYSALCGWLSRGVLDFDFFMELLKRPILALMSNPTKALLFVLMSPLTFTLAVFLIPIGIWAKRPETLRLYAKQADDVDTALGSSV